MSSCQDNKTTYLFASCKTWHRPYFDALTEDTGANWVWVSSPEELIEALARVTPRYIFFLHWSWIVPPSIWNHHECVCFHMTDVPYGRGGSPLQNLIMAGHRHTKLTALRMEGEMDAGPVYAKRDLALSGTAQQIYLRAGALSVDIMLWMISAMPEPTPQVGEPTLFQRRTPAQSRIPGALELDGLYDFIRMLDADGYPHAFLDYGEFRLEFRDAQHHGTQLTAAVTLYQRPNEANDGGDN